jgi:hypothetical protein
VEDREAQHEGVAGPGQISSSNSLQGIKQPRPAGTTTASQNVPPKRGSQEKGGDTPLGDPGPGGQEARYRSPNPQVDPHRGRTANVPRADPVQRTSSVQTPVKSFSVSSPALNRPGVSMSSSDPQARAQESVSGLSHTPAERGGKAPPMGESNGNPMAVPNGVALPSEHTPSRTEAHSRNEPPSRARPMVRDNSVFSQNEDVRHDPKRIIEKKRTATLDEWTGSKPEVSSKIGHGAQHRQTEPSSQTSHASPTVPSPVAFRPSVGREVQPRNLIDRNDSGSTHAHDTGETGLGESHKRRPEVPPLLTASPTAIEHPPAPPPPAFKPPPKHMTRSMSPPQNTQLNGDTSSVQPAFGEPFI